MALGRQNLLAEPRRGLIAGFREISIGTRVRGGPERTRTPGTQFYRTSFCHCPMLQARAHRAGAKVASDAANQTNTAGVVPSALILRSNIARATTCREKAGNPRRLERYCRQFPGAKGAPRSCPAGSIAVGGASVVRRPPRTERRRSCRVATWWRYRLEYENVRLI
jgi:hypothetical protein